MTGLRQFVIVLSTPLTELLLGCRGKRRLGNSSGRGGSRSNEDWGISDEAPVHFHTMTTASVTVPDCGWMMAMAKKSWLWTHKQNRNRGIGICSNINYCLWIYKINEWIDAVFVLSFLFSLRHRGFSFGIQICWNGYRYLRNYPLYPAKWDELSEWMVDGYEFVFMYLPKSEVLVYWTTKRYKFIFYANYFMRNV